MMAVPRPSERAADEQADTPVNGTPALPAPAAPSDDDLTTDFETTEFESDETDLATNGSVVPTQALALNGPHLIPDPGLYAVLGLDPAVSDGEIRAAYTRQAARVHGGGANSVAALRQLNVAYEVLGNPARRVDYDRLRLSQASVPDQVAPVRPGVKNAAPLSRRRRPRSIVQPRYAGLGDVFVVLSVVGLAVLAGVWLIPHLSINLSALNVLQNVLPLASTARRADSGATPAQATQVPTVTVAPAVAQHFAGSSASVSDAAPAQNASETITLKLRAEGQPAANVDVWAVVHYSTTDERWPANGAVKTDATGAASITFNVGRPIPQHPVTIDVFAQAGNQQASWPTTFTPR